MKKVSKSNNNLCSVEAETNNKNVNEISKRMRMSYKESNNSVNFNNNSTDLPERNIEKTKVKSTFNKEESKPNKSEEETFDSSNKTSITRPYNPDHGIFTNLTKDVIYNLSSKTFKKKVVLTIPKILQNIISLNEQSKRSNSSPFDTDPESILNLEKYITRIVKLSQAENFVLVYWLALIDEFCGKNKIFLTSKNVHMVIFVALVVSIKMQHDIIYRHKDYAFIGGISSEELKELEFLFLEIVNYRTFITKEKFDVYYNTFIQLDL